MRRRILWILLPATLVLAACGGKPDDDASAASEEFCGYDETTLVPAAKAAISPDSTFRMTLDMSGADVNMALDADVAHTGDGADMKMTSRTPGDEYALVIVDGRFFVSDSPGGTYEEIDSSDPAAAELRAAASNMDVETTFASWEAGIEKVKRIGEEKIDGVDVCHYTLTVDTADAAAAQDLSLPPGAPEKIDYELFLTTEDLMRRVTFSVAGIGAEINLTRWNEPVDIKVPPSR